MFPDNSDVDLQKSNILLIGPTLRKTLFAQTPGQDPQRALQSQTLPPLTEAGYVGDDVENILLRLLQAADFDVGAGPAGHYLHR